MISKISRGRFAAASLSLAAATAAMRRSAGAAQFVYKCGEDSGASDPLTVRAVQMWKAVEGETNGRLMVRTFPDNQLGSITSQFASLRSGAQEFMLNSGAQFGELVPVAQIENLGYAFRDTRQALTAFDGPLGDYVRKQIEAAGIVVMPRIWANGMRDVINSVRPIKAAPDLEGLKLRMPPSKIFIDMFRTLGTSPTPLAANEIYTSMQTRLVDGAELPLSFIDQNHMYEVQKYLSITNHIWAGKWIIANKDAWNALPQDIRDVVVRNSIKFGALERRDYIGSEEVIKDKLRREGLVVNPTDPASFRARLGAYYGRWKTEFGATAWALLEGSTGKLG